MDTEDRTTTTYRIPVRYWADQCRAEIRAARARAELSAAREHTTPKEPNP